MEADEMKLLDRIAYVWLGQYPSPVIALAAREIRVAIEVRRREDMGPPALTPAAERSAGR